ALVLSVAVRDWGEHPDALAAAFAEDRHAPETMSAGEVARLSEPDPWADAPDHVRADVPQWVVPLLADSPGGSWIEEARGFTLRPPLDLRVNTLKSNRDRVLKALARFNAQPTALTPHGIRIAAGDRDSRTPNVQAE